MPNRISMEEKAYGNDSDPRNQHHTTISSGRKALPLDTSNSHYVLLGMLRTPQHF
jgi:hypothetical protein